MWTQEIKNKFLFEKPQKINVLCITAQIYSKNKIYIHTIYTIEKIPAFKNDTIYSKIPEWKK